MLLGHCHRYCFPASVQDLLYPRSVRPSQSSPAITYKQVTRNSNTCIHEDKSMPRHCHLRQRYACTRGAIMVTFVWWSQFICCGTSLLAFEQPLRHLADCISWFQSVNALNSSCKRPVANMSTRSPSAEFERYKQMSNSATGLTHHYICAVSKAFRQNAVKQGRNICRTKCSLIRKSNKCGIPL